MIEKRVRHKTPVSESDIQHLFAQLPAHEIEQFYAAFQRYSLQQRLQEVEAAIEQSRQSIADNERHMQAITPSPIALSELIQLQVCGVEDIDLLDRMLERGEEWLDHTMQLLRRCEQLNMIEEGYTHWCEHALEGAYEWIDSMQDSPLPSAPSETASRLENPTEPADTSLTETENATIAIEDQLLRKLMSDDDDEEEISFTIRQPTQARITQPLPRITQPLPTLVAAEEIINTAEAAVETESVGTELASARPDTPSAVSAPSQNDNDTQQPEQEETINAEISIVEEEEQKQETISTPGEHEPVAEASAQPRQQTNLKLRGRWRRSLAKILRQ
jgi:hypothetical protein